MIGLGSNRLTVCRRGGMRVTQAGRGGMEWLAGGRMPSWASPYSVQATAALKAAFTAAQWEIIKAYGFAHPEIVPYVNANPLCAAIWCCYVQDGLVFQMDCDYECTAAKWKDVRSAIEFIGTNVQIVDDVPYFNGTNAYMQMSSIHHYDWNTHTVEVVIRNEKTGFNPILADRKSLSGTIAVVLRNDMLCWVQSTSNMAAYTDTSDIGFKTLSFNKERGYKNTNQLVGRSGDTLGHDIDYIVLGARHYNGAYSGFYKGYIHSIRIYNRLLTEQEILANQAIDLQRWQPS